MNILVTGATGLLGQALMRRLAGTHQVLGVSRHAPAEAAQGPQACCDLLDVSATTQLIATARPSVVIHAQALSDVDRCEREPDLALAMNAQAVGNVARALASLPSHLVYISTDYVFSGTRQPPYLETDAPDPLSAYGRSKRDGERVALAFPRGIVVRTSTIFGSGRTNFCDYIVSQLQAGQPVQAFADQVTSPTYSDDLAEALQEIAEALGTRSGAPAHRIYHATNAGSCTRVEFAARTAALLGCAESFVRPIRMADQHRPAPRPAHAVLASTALPQLIGRTLRPWDQALEAYLRQRRLIV